eukprot:1348018-Heterocapsa_arctica.AAC.1
MPLPPSVACCLAVMRAGVQCPQSLTCRAADLAFLRWFFLVFESMVLVSCTSRTSGFMWSRRPDLSQLSYAETLAVMRVSISPEGPDEG